LQLLYLALAVFAFRGLLTFGSQADLSRELEEWFFIPTETSPLVVVLLACWLVYRRAPRLAALTSEPATWAVSLPLLLLGVASFAWSTLTTAPHLLALSMVFTGLATAGIHFGPGGIRIALLPSLLLIFAVPIPAPLLAEVVYDFQIWTAEYAGWLLFVLGESAYVQGDQVLLAQNHFAVIEGCSGLRSVQTLTMVAVLLVELFGRRGAHAWTIILLAPTVAFALNGFRVLALILNPHSEVVAIHNLQGVAILLAGLVILYGIDGLLERYMKQAEIAPLPEGTRQPPLDRVRVAAVTTALAAMSVLSLALHAWEPAQPGGRLVDGDLPAQLDEWKGSRGETDRSFLGTIGYRHLFDLSYEAPDAAAAVDVFMLVGDLDQRYRSPLSPKTASPGSGWLVEDSGDLEREGTIGGSWRLMRAGTRRVLLRHWYEGTEGLGSEVARGLFALDSSPWHRPSDVIVVRLATRVVGATEGAVEEAQGRLDQIEGSLGEALDSIRWKARRMGSDSTDESAAPRLPKVGKFLPIGVFDPHIEIV